MVLAAVFVSGCAGQEIIPAKQGPRGHADTGTKPVNLSAPVTVSPSLVPVTAKDSRPVLEPLLTRPTDHSVDVSILPLESLLFFIDWREAGGIVYERTPSVSSEAGTPRDILISGLKPDTEYLYRIGFQRPGSSRDQYGQESWFHSARAIGTSFVFDIQADSHLDDRARGDLYRVTLENERSDNPDFLIDLGDTFMTDKLQRKDNRSVLARYLLQRSYLTALDGSVPLFLVLGNHDGEEGWQENGASSLASMSLADRKQYFSGPEPDDFYSGDQVRKGPAGLLEDYYAWQWGDALFVVLDPYWFTTTKPGGKGDGWGWTLGDAQYKWLVTTLEQSHAQYKFVFSHHLVGGNDTRGRGGTEYANLYEWGGHNADGSWGFSEHRPGWKAPIHRILVENHVTAFFHGHDHFFDRQELDGAVYQEVPQPATMPSGKDSLGTEYGYITGVELQSPGYLRVNVSPESAQIEYIRSALPGDTGAGVMNGKVVYSYTLAPYRGG